jgi:hypothetical protein
MCWVKPQRWLLTNLPAEVFHHQQEPQQVFWQQVHRLPPRPWYPLHPPGGDQIARGLYDCELLSLLRSEQHCVRGNVAS